MNPLRAAQRIEDSYRRYLRTSFSPRTPDLRSAFEQALSEDFRLTRGPYLQAAAPYASGATVRGLVEEGVLHDGFRRLEATGSFPLDRPLHLHQEQAIRKAVTGGRNLVVATGTGSGKTECFLLPIIDALLREADAGSIGRPGVRALLLYPMNALANDQLRRLRTMLAPLDEITFGRYVGDTPHGEKEALDAYRTRFPLQPRIPGELLARDEMQASPPHILLTNFAMLEYLLLRPRDSSLFDGETGEHWRYLALDEAHVYDGASGSEIAMLLRRVRDRVVGSARGRLQCFATSATLGRGIEDFPDLIEYSTSLFDERFEWDDDDTDRQDIVSATRRPLAQEKATYTLPSTAYRELNQARVSDEPIRRVTEVLERYGVSATPVTMTDGVDAVLARHLSKDANTIAVQERLEAGSAELATVADEALSHDATVADLVDLVSVAVAAKRRDDDAPLLPAKYHFFLRSLEGAYLCLAPTHPSGKPKLLLARHEQCPACEAAGRSARMFELGTCRRCGAEYIVGMLRNEELIQAPPFGALMYLLLGDQVEAVDEDEAPDEVDDDTPTLERFVCPYCGRVAATPSSPCACDEAENQSDVRLTLVKGHVEDAGLRRCAACSSRTTGEIVSRFVAGADAPVSVIATSVYQELPASSEARMRDQVGEGRKLLVFADSRQDAAFFAPYLERTYQRAVQRALIRDEVERAGIEDPMRFEDFVPLLKKRAEDRLVLDPDSSRATNQNEVRSWLLQEVLATDRRQSLEGTGLVEIAIARPRRFEAPLALLRLGFSAADVEDLVRLLLETVKAGAAVSVPEGLDIREEVFAPRNREYGLRGERSEMDVIAWVPGRGSNRRLDILNKIMARKGADVDPLELLERLWEYLSEPGGVWSSVLTSYTDKRHGPLWRLDHERFELLPLTDSHRPYRCDRCRQLTWRTVESICPTYACDGTVTPVESAQGLLENHYARLYETLAPIGMAVQEHTAQWTQAAGAEIQDAFMRGAVNVLSCSTTFELGVDVGEVESVLLRNVPPSPANYVQRAGRAGRRLSSAALVATYAQRRNHDLAFFADPTKMIDGVIRPPTVRVDNPTIVRRHIHAVAFAAFERDVEEHRDVGAFFEPQDGSDAADVRFVEWLRSHPRSLHDAVRRVVPDGVADILGIEQWAWVDALVEESTDDPTQGWLRRASLEVATDLGELTERIEEAVAEEQFGRAQAYQRQQATIRKSTLLSFLARKNVLPKYGFPVDVIPLDLGRHGDADASRLQLDRDLKVAISEYAPGAQVVAAKALWQSQGLRVQPGRDWPQREWGVCRRCGSVRQGLTELPPECGVCQSPDINGFLSRKYVIPLFGFVGVRSQTKPGETRPQRMWFTESHFSEYQDGAPDLEVVEDLSNAGQVTRMRTSRQGRITVLNRGPRGRGFQLCHRCGHGEAAPEPGKRAGRRKSPEHRDIRRPGNVPCRQWLEPAFLGHEYLTDVLEVRTTLPMTVETARSALYALLEGVAALSIKREELDGTLFTYGYGDPSAFVVFDTVPGGAGHAQRVGRRLRDVVEAAHARMLDCECGPETSCYQCLRSYSNQVWHDTLSRGAAARVMESLLGSPTRTAPSEA